MSTSAPAAPTARGTNPLNWRSDPTWTWTTVNTAETLPGVLMPLSWSFWEAAIEYGMRRTFCDFGVLRPEEVAHPSVHEERFTAVFQGRYAVAINAMRKVGDRMIGTDADAVEEQIFGSVTTGLQAHNELRRYPVVLAKMPQVAYKLPKRLQAARAETQTWWQEQTRPELIADLAGAADRMVAARERFETLMHVHAASTMLAQAAYDQVTELCAAAGREGLERRLVTGYGDMEEARVAADLWAVSRGRLPLGEFVAHHGYHGPREGAVDSRSWRQDQSPLLGLLATYQRMPDEDDPAGSAAARSTERERAERELLAGLPRHGRLKARAVLGFARRHVPLREVSKAAFLQAIDVGRANAHAHGQWLAEQGHLDEPADVFFLRLDEVGARRTEGLRELVAERRAEREGFLAVDLPDMWTGQPETTLVDVSPQDGEVAGLAVSSGVVEGRARVVLDLEEDDDIEPGEILVCKTTDPSWASWFHVASALVIDIGGVMSHGAIVAREMGVPCVINTRNGTRRLRTGDLVRVDGDAGTVTLLSRDTEDPS